MIKLAKYLKPYRKQAIIGPIFKLIEAIFELIVPLVMAKIIDYGINGEGGTVYVWKMGIVLVVLAAVGLGFSLICQTLASIASQGYGTILRNELYEHINSLSFKEIDKFGTNTMITRLTNDVNQMQLAVAMLIRIAVRAPFLVIGATILACIINIYMGLIFLIITILISVILYLIMSKSVPYYKNVQESLDNITTITNETIDGIRVIRAFSQQETEQKRFDVACEDFKKNVVKVNRISSLLNPLTYLFINIGIIASLWYGGLLVDNGTLSQGDITALVNYMMQILLALIVLANLIVIFTKASSSAQRINEVFDVASSMVEGEKQDVNNTSVKIEFKDVSFAYNQDSHALDNITFKMDKESIIGIIGGTGSGKSTIAQLISHDYIVTNGLVLLDDYNINDYQQSFIKSIISYVPQKNILFSGTIRDNLLWRDLSATDEELWNVLEIAQAKEFVEKYDDGLDHIISQSGKNLSGGQKQRLCIARALVGNPKIVILDDSFSALDYRTDAMLRHALREKLNDTKIIMTSQRIATLMHCDFIICLADGKIAGIGSHNNLLETCSVYQEIYQSQFKKEGENNV